MTHRCQSFKVIKELKRSAKKVYQCRHCGMITLTQPRRIMERCGPYRSHDRLSVDRVEIRNARENQRLITE